MGRIVRISILINTPLRPTVRFREFKFHDYLFILCITTTSLSVVKINWILNTFLAG